ncbi:hypothetical protein H112_04858 [Trichophyton rubrum D6]|uniref:Guanylate kinase-like domain-containing protein n=1 Tax=Trichophyton rubrum CBS 288.86 TaxID=1215330 RepID=A0A022W0Z9_TRIRU|nr:hypothetical protein H100_04870 [Trichophyton rubrum MR850]EZF41288.1 hypothetical protein H102_04855 [Trichophyton rubrum CBS 100081]EZF51914.1 hypothetical protein H103_04860 [Trichophyton rubrum CBS 288.86]EZF62499.1 hypothetical protein H104_04851 [Trichophyton rubrum CBS 289.86]EZF83792.1 hypothetical protein H110_04857 [Trichophyton rubrum MR1448]EZG16180.1 hypothetical protein H107_04988 [Trichophyton rubrum CBS 202.88]KDB33072.1 hypothetical protein H112_04858 [Trichophyton rubrum 
MSQGRPLDRRPIIISGPSGIGKVSHTTRGPRPGEVESIAYFFINGDTFSALASQDLLVEYTTFNGHH